MRLLPVFFAALLPSAAVLADDAPGATPAPAAPSSAAPPEAAPSPTDETVRKRPLRIAVYKLATVGVDERVERITEASLLEEVRKLQRSSVLSMDEVQALLSLEADKQLLGCSESSCLAEIAEALGADALITGEVTQIDDAVTVAWKRIDPTAAAVVHTFTRRLTAANGEELLAAVGPAVEALFPDLPLRPGQARGVAAEVALRLNPPPLSPWVFWSVTGATGALAIASLGAGALFFTSDANLRSTYAAAQKSAVPAQQVLDQQAQVQASNAALWGFVGATGVGAVAAAFTAPFTDWQNLRSEQ